MQHRKKIRWTTTLLLFAAAHRDPTALANRLGISRGHLRRKITEFLEVRPGQPGKEYLKNADSHIKMMEMIGEARYRVCLVVPYLERHHPMIRAMLELPATVELRLVLTADPNWDKVPEPDPRWDNSRIQMRSSWTAHNKLLIADNTACWGSANLTRAARTGKNHESGTYSDTLETVQDAQSHFEQIYREAGALKLGL